jgi:hypothetical protein
MSDEYAARKAPDELKSFDFAKADGSIRTMHARDGLLHPQDAEDDAALTAAGYAVDPDSAKKVEEARAARAEKEAEAASKPAEPMTEAQIEKADEKAADAAKEAK